MKNPHPLFDLLIKEYSLKNDAALAKALDFTPMAISKIRSGFMQLSPRSMILIYKKTGMSIEDIEEVSGIKIE